MKRFKLLNYIFSFSIVTFALGLFSMSILYRFGNDVEIVEASSNVSDVSNTNFHFDYNVNSNNQLSNISLVNQYCNDIIYNHSHENGTLNILGQDVVDYVRYDYTYDVGFRYNGLLYTSISVNAIQWVNTRNASVFQNGYQLRVIGDMSFDIITENQNGTTEATRNIVKALDDLQIVGGSDSTNPYVLRLFNYFSTVTGYNTYEEGILTQQQYEDIIAGLNTTIANQQETIEYLKTTNEFVYQDGYADGVASQQQLIVDARQEGYSSGYTDGHNVNQTAATIFSGILQVALVPINFFLAIFNFEILGINLSGFIRALFTVAITIIVIKSVIGGKGASED